VPIKEIMTSQALYQHSRSWWQRRRAMSSL